MTGLTLRVSARSCKARRGPGLALACLFLLQACAAGQRDAKPAADAAHPSDGSLLAYWQGNSARGQLADSSGHQRDLVAVNGVPNPLSPTPPEGDRWLSGDLFPTHGYFKVPVSAVPSNAEGKFSVTFYHRTLPCCGARTHQVILSMANAEHNRYLNLGYADAGFRCFYVDYSDQHGALVSVGEAVSPNLKPQPGAVVQLQVEWSPAGVSIIENGVVTNSNKAPLDHGELADVRIGTQGDSPNNSTQNYLDAAAFFSDIHAAYPPVLPRP